MILGTTMLGLAFAAQSTQPESSYVFCAAWSDKVWNTGPIVTSIYPTTARDVANIRYGFVDFLKRTYAPYGNNWQFQEMSAFCQIFPDMEQAQDALGQFTGPTESAGGHIFRVAFVPTD